MTKFADLSEREEIIHTLHSWANQHPEVRRVHIYGSRARGDHRLDSDIDVAIEIDPAQGDSGPFATWCYERINWQSGLAPNLPWPLHLEWYDPAGRTPTVACKMAKGAYLAFERSV